MADNFSEDVVDRLLQRLATDDEFRALFQRDPRAALREVGHETPAEDVGIPGQDPVMCLTASATLADKDTIRKARARLREQLSGSAFHQSVII